MKRNAPSLEGDDDLFEPGAAASAIVAGVGLASMLPRDALGEPRGGDTNPPDRIVGRARRAWPRSKVDGSWHRLTSRDRNWQFRWETRRPVVPW